MSKEGMPTVNLDKIRPGSEIKITPVELFPGVVPSETALHEAEHIVPDPDNVRRATIISGKGYLGLTELYQFNAVQAAAPHARGRRGTSHDLRVIEHQGHDVGASISAANKILTPLDKKVDLVASLLQVSKEISGYEAKEVMKEADDPKESIEYEVNSGKIVSIIGRRSERQAIVHGLKAA